MVLAGLMVGLFVPATAQAGGSSTLYFACASCHGVKAEGNKVKNGPALAGLDAGYLNTQMLAYKYDRRGVFVKDRYGKQMALIAKAYSDEQIRLLADYIAGLAPPPRSMPVQPPEAILARANIANGENLYQLCAACHGAQAEGNKAMQSPRLDILDAPYLVRQLQHYRDGLRGYHPDDDAGRNMAAIMQGETGLDKNIIDVTAYILSLQGK